MRSPNTCTLGIAGKLTLRLTVLIRPVITVFPRFRGVSKPAKGRVPSGFRVIPITPLLPVSNWGRLKGVITPLAGGVSSRLKIFPGWDRRTKLVPGTAMMVTVPPELTRLPVFKIAPPKRVRFCPGVRVKFPALMILPARAVLKTN